MFERRARLADSTKMEVDPRDESLLKRTGEQGPRKESNSGGRDCPFVVEVENWAKREAVKVLLGEREGLSKSHEWNRRWDCARSQNCVESGCLRCERSHVLVREIRVVGLEVGKKCFELELDEVGLMLHSTKSSEEVVVV